MKALVLLIVLCAAATAFTPNLRVHRSSASTRAFDSEAPSDYDADDLLTEEKRLLVDENEEDADIRQQLQQELLLLSSVTDRGEYATKDEQDIMIDIVAQLEALNPQVQPAENSQGEWDLALASTEIFRCSPFFQAIRVAMDEKSMAENFFALHDRATTASRIGRVRQIITDDQVISEVDLEVGLPFLPLKTSGTVITTASILIAENERMSLTVDKTLVRGSDLPVLNGLLDQIKLEIPVGDVYSSLKGQNPVIPLKTFYLDEGMRITRDVDDNFFVFTRA